MPRTFTTDEYYAFIAYFDVADELDGGMTLHDLDDGGLDQAVVASRRFGLSWPPYLADAEEYALKHRAALQAARVVAEAQ